MLYPGLCCTSELGQWHPCNRLQCCEKQRVQICLPGEDVSDVIWQFSLYCCWVTLNNVVKLSNCASIVDTPAFLFTPTRTARSQWKSRSRFMTGKLVCTDLQISYWAFHCVFISIYKMFPADKKRVESALASAHLPKGKVRKHTPLRTNNRPTVCYLFKSGRWHVSPFQFDTIKSDVFTELAFKLFLQNLCPRPEIYEIFTS